MSWDVWELSTFWWPSWDSAGFGVPQWSCRLWKRNGRLWYPSFVFWAPADNDGIIGLPARKNSHYSQCFMHPPSSTTISSYWVTLQHTNKTLSAHNQAPTYTPNPPVSSVPGMPLPPFSSPLHPSLTVAHSHPSPLSCCTSACWKHRLNTCNYSALRGLSIWGRVWTRLLLPKSLLIPV